MSTQPILIGGLPAVTLKGPVASDAREPHFCEAVILPGRAAALLQLKAAFDGGESIDVMAAPCVEEAAIILDGGPHDFCGNALFSMGAANLLPYANRIRGRVSSTSRTIETEVLGRTVRLPANGSGRAPGAEQYAQHGLLLERAVDWWACETGDRESRFRARLSAGDFGWGWPSSTDVAFEAVIRGGFFDVAITATNVGREPSPMGIGWHPYFSLPSGRREQARLHVPARKRLLVNDYGEVLPTGEIARTARSPYDFSMPGGRELESLYLDDCFVDLQKSAEGQTVCAIEDPASAYGLRIIARSPQVKAVQVYAPPERAHVAVEPQFNWADPYGEQWGGVDTGMVVLQPGEDVSYRVTLELFRPRLSAGHSG